MPPLQKTRCLQFPFSFGEGGQRPDEATKAWAGKTTKEYKMLKGLKKENLRDNMTNTELILNMLAEASTKDISAATNPATFEASKKVAKQGGNVAKVGHERIGS